ncbi:MULTISPECIES: bifunctional diguanylate cyclase/phosphodiesterase [unclassified Janthinobacterium]|uniref:putative bifunctional diguanylate cyclase/phosphodiesterase n=1 Tax=unclassified Janthinobacterium TaxID=2610881 RepID=UPI001E43FDDC|nr:MULTISPECIES: EAL domain-containing protein [unclassified Janthinobacterium]MCC7642813.1 EAL domain-containing protein [Janthinobacterium sp. EB271-G4-3-1]MCC7692889.1 EAL domain-containing protein [Janthinobacterium sp. EB271-G4-3-2]
MAASNDLAHWRGQIFARLLQAVLLLGIVTAIPSALLAAREAIWSIVALDLLAIGWIGLIWHLRAMPYRWRVWQFLIVAYLVGVGLLMKIGPVSQIYMMLMPVLAALLLGMRPALSTLALTSLTIFLLGLHPDVELQLRGVPDSPVLRALIVALNFLFIAAVLTLSCAFLLRHLERSSQALSQLNADLRLTATALARLNDMVMIAEVADVLPDPDPGTGAAPATRIIFVNDAFERSSGYARAEVLGRSLLFQQGPATDADELARVAAAMARAQPARAELLNYNKAGKAYWVEAELVPFTDADGRQTHWVAVEREIDERKKSEADIHRLAFYDVLTGLPNRRLLMDRIGHLLAAAPRNHTISALMFIDLDHFKHINDARGHATGDALLRLAGERLAQLMRKADTVARLGGDEFVVLLAHLADDLDSAARAAAQVAEKIRAAIARDFEIGAQSYHCSASIGVTLLPKMEQQAHDLLREADIAMYRAKAEGRNGIAFFEAAMQAGVERRLTLERALARALDDGALCMHVQPQVDRHGRVTGAELLMRWPQADGSHIAPDIFIPIAEESGLIVKLGHWALREACRAARVLAQAGSPVPLSVNVSPAQFRQPDFASRVQAALAEHGTPAGALILELTEGLLIDQRDASLARMRELAELGIRFSIDDFGTGYSSLAYLTSMPLYELKIDKRFIDDTPHDARGTAIVQAILAMARHLGLRVVAEGVETQEQADFLIAHDCDGLQGFLYARPMPLADFLAWLAGHQA